MAARRPFEVLLPKDLSLDFPVQKALPVSSDELLYSKRTSPPREKIRFEPSAETRAKRAIRGILIWSNSLSEHRCDASD